MWQPIETAPKDKTPVLLHEAGNVFTGSFAWGQWWDEYDNAKAPTEWMPFPEPPETFEEKIRKHRENHFLKPKP